MTKEWFSAAELAGAPGVPSTVRGLNKIAKRENWQSRPRTGRGGGREYHINALPPATQHHLRHQAAVAAANAESACLGALGAGETAAAATRAAGREGDLATFAALGAGAKRARAEARVWLIKRFGEYRRSYALGQKAALRAFITDFRAGAIALPATHAAWLPRYEGARALSVTTLERWVLAYRRAGAGALIDGYGNRTHDSKIDRNPALKRIVIGALVQAPHITPKKIKHYLAAAAPEFDIVSVKGIERFCRRWRAENAQVFTYLTHPDKWKNIYMAAHGSQHAPIERLNQLWELDSTPADWMLKDGRHSVVGVIDLYSRRLKFQVSKTSTAAAVCALLRRAILAWGVPEGARSDNGKDYVSEQLELVLDGLEIAHELCIPFASEEKGTIERAMQTLSHGILDLLPGFIGHNVAERKVIEARKSFAKRMMSKGEAIEVELDAAELQAVLDQWCEHIYARDGHSGAGMAGKSPFEVATAWREPIRTITDVRALDALLAPVAGRRTVTKKGVALARYTYIHPALVVHTGREVHLRRDEADLGRVYVYSLAGAFVCVAECPELTGIDRAEWAAAAKAAGKKFMAEQGKDYRAFKRELKGNIGQTIIEHRIAQSETITALPAPSVAYTTAALTEAGKAARANDGPEATAPSDEEKAAHQAIVTELYAEQPKPESARQRFQRWVRTARRDRDGERLGAGEARFLNAYQTSIEAAVEYDMHLDFALLIDGAPVDVIPVAAQKKARGQRA